MVDVTTSEVGEITDPKLRKVMQPVLRELELAALKVAAHHQQPAGFALPKSSKSLERVLDARFQTLPAATKAAASTNALVRLTGTKAAQAAHFGPLAEVDLASDEPIDVLVEKLAPASPATLTLDELRRAVGMPKAAKATSLAPLDKLELRLLRVKCVDETGSGLREFGADEIKLGGTAVDETGGTTKVSPFKVRNFGDDGDVKDYSPPKRLQWFNLREGKEFPKRYFMTFVLAEVDMGSLPEFVDTVYGFIRTKVEEAVTKAASQKLGPLGPIIGKAVAWVMDKAYELFKRIWNDDIFPPVAVYIDVPTMTHRFPGGGTDSRNQVVTFKGHNGTYELTYDWRLFT